MFQFLVVFMCIILIPLYAILSSKTKHKKIKHNNCDKLKLNICNNRHIFFKSKKQ
jgi:hypothetical protein